MSTYTQIIYQIVFSTKYRDYTLNGIDKRLLLYKYIWGVMNNNKCIVYKINGIENHMHIATHIHPSVSLSSLVKDIKVSSSLWIKQNNLFPGFKGWAQGYGAFTYHIKLKATLERYIENQVEHHSKISFDTEYKEILTENGIQYQNRFLY